MAITFGASGLPSYITDALPPSPATRTRTRTVSGGTAGESNRFRNLLGQARSNAAATAAARQPAVKPQPVNVTGVAIPSYAFRPDGSAVSPASVARANEINAGVVTGQPVQLGSTGTGEVVSAPVTTSPPPSGGGGGGGAVEEAPIEETPVEPDVDVQALYDSILAGLLEADWLGFQGDQAAELRRLQNLRNQLFGDAEYGTTGSVQRQRDLDAQARRRLAAQRAVSGMLQGGAYAGTQRGVGTLQQAEQEYALQEMLRPFREQTASDRLLEFGLGFEPDSRVFNLLDFGMPDDIMGGWAASTWAGREAKARARQAALQQLAQRGLSLD